VTGDTHYDLETLAELAEGLLDEATARQVREHLAICDPCGESLADLSAVRELLAAVPTPAMPLGVAMRIEQALAAERTVTVSTLGVVDDDGQIVRRRSSRRWALPVGVTAAAAVVVGSTAIATSLLLSPQTPSASGPSESSVAAPSRTQQLAPAIAMFASGHNYTGRELSGPLVDYFSAAPGNYSSAEDLDKCVKRRSNQLDRRPIAVDQALYNGNEATIMVFWENEATNRVRVVVVDDSCKTLRKDALAAWK
jgi:hypothetical protein